MRCGKVVQMTLNTMTRSGVRGATSLIGVRLVRETTITLGNMNGPPVTLVILVWCERVRVTIEKMKVRRRDFLIELVVCVYGSGHQFILTHTKVFRIRQPTHFYGGNVVRN